VGFPAALGPPQNPPRLARERYGLCNNINTSDDQYLIKNRKMTSVYTKCFLLCYLIFQSITAFSQADASDNEQLLELYKSDSLRYVQDSLNNLWKDSTYVLIIHTSDLQVIVNKKIDWLLKNHIRNQIAILTFTEKNNTLYAKLEANLKEGWTNYSPNLVGTFLVKNYRIFVINHSGLSINSYFGLANEKYYLPKKNTSEFPTLIEFPTWTFIKQGEKFKEISFSDN
jgi:hypothetical protein